MGNAHYVADGMLPVTIGGYYALAIREIFLNIGNSGTERYALTAVYRVVYDCNAHIGDTAEGVGVFRAAAVVYYQNAVGLLFKLLYKRNHALFRFIGRNKNIKIHCLSLSKDALHHI